MNVEFIGSALLGPSGLKWRCGGDRLAPFEGSRGEFSSLQRPSHPLPPGSTLSALTMLQSAAPLIWFRAACDDNLWSPPTPKSLISPTIEVPLSSSVPHAKGSGTHDNGTAATSRSLSDCSMWRPAELPALGSSPCWHAYAGNRGPEPPLLRSSPWKETSSPYSCPFLLSPFCPIHPQPCNILCP